MGKDFINPFNWSRSRMGCFNECKRKYYLRYYLHWGGWDAHAPQLSRLAYRLGKMTTLPMVAGSAVHEVLANYFRMRRLGRECHLDPEEPVEIMRRAWRDGKLEKWRVNPKKHPPLFELYYDRVPSDEKLKDRAQKARKAIENWTKHPLFPALLALGPKDYLWIDTAGGVFSQSTIFPVGEWSAISNPDLVVKMEDRVLIIDWKTGKPRPEDRIQMAADGLWAQAYLRKEADKIEGCLIYLESGEVNNFPLESRLLKKTSTGIKEDMERMSEYLADPKKNIPLDREKFPLHNDQNRCRYCQFQEICLPDREADSYS